MRFSRFVPGAVRSNGDLRALGRRGGALATGVVAAVALSACGTTAAPQPGSTPAPSASPGPLRAVTRQPVAADGGLRCPATLGSNAGLSVPQKPQGVDGAARLLPDRQPSSLVVCGYPVTDVRATTPLVAPFPLVRRTLATAAQRADVVELLTWAPRSNGKARPCTLMAADETAYLVGAAYGDATVWVAAKADANSCSTSTNGDFVSGAALGVDLDAMFGARQPPPGQPAACTARTWGRLGDDRSLAPAGDPLVTVCRLAADGSTRATSLSTARSAEVVAALRALPTRPTDGTCQGSGRESDARFTLVLSYAAGPSERIDVDPGCRPAVLGSNLQTADSASIVDLVDLVEQWSPPIPGPDPNGSVSSDGLVAPGPPDIQIAPGAPGAGSLSPTAP